MTEPIHGRGSGSRLWESFVKGHRIFRGRLIQYEKENIVEEMVDSGSAERAEDSLDSSGYDVSKSSSYDVPRTGVRRMHHHSAPRGGSGHPYHHPQQQPYYYSVGNPYYGAPYVDYGPDFSTSGMGPIPLSYQQQQQQQHMMLLQQQQQYYAAAAALQQQQYHMMQYHQHHQHHQHQYIYQHQPIHMMRAMTMEELKSYVMRVDARDVKTVIRQALFQPRQMAFTSLMQMAGKSKQTDKAVALFEAMKEADSLKPNTFSYTALISALARVGDWKRAEAYFKEMKEVARTDETVSPNRVTFSSMISVYDKADMFDMAMKTYKEQLESNIQPDLITYASILTACQRAGSLRDAIDILEEMHSNGLLGPLQLYHTILAECVGDWESAMGVFLSMQCAGITTNATTLALVMKALCAGGQKNHAVSLMRQADASGIKMNIAFYDSVLALCSDHGDFASADETCASMMKHGVQLSGHSAGLVISAHMQGGDNVESIEAMNVQFESQGITPVLPVKQEVVEHNASPAVKAAAAAAAAAAVVGKDIVVMEATNIGNTHGIKHGTKGTTAVCDTSVANVSLGSTQSEIDVSHSV